MAEGPITTEVEKVAPVPEKFSATRLPINMEVATLDPVAAAIPVPIIILVLAVAPLVKVEFPIIILPVKLPPVACAPTPFPLIILLLIVLVETGKIFTPIILLLPATVARDKAPVAPALTIILFDPVDDAGKLG
jgi:hypothetical protein